MTPSSGSFYVGHGRARLKLSSWQDVELAAASGVLEETAWVENKQALPAASKPANREFAKDLASLSLDGGLLLIGVSNTFEVVGTADETDSLRTRIIQVASTIISPPLFVDVTFLNQSDGRSPSGTTMPELHVAVVAVPSSGSAPHMVDGHYWGRNSEGKRVLADSEVDRLMGERRHRASLLDVDLRSVERDIGPLVEGAPKHGHMVFVARPNGAASRSVTSVLAEVYPPQVVNDARDFAASWSPWSSAAGQHSHHPEGLLFSSDDHRFNQFVAEEWAHRTLLREDGAVLFLGGAATMEMTHHRLPDPEEALVCGYVLEGVHCLTRLAAHVASEYLEYWGDWQVGVLITGLRGRYATARYGSSSGYELRPYPKDDYLMMTSSSTREMLDSPPIVVDRLLRLLLRTLGVDRLYLPYEDGAAIQQRNAHY